MSRRPFLYLIDGSSYIYRAFYAIPSLKTKNGFPTNAIYGFITMLNKILKEKRPDYLAMVFDSKGPTHRSALYKEYKSHRPSMPEDLIPQIPYIHEVVRAFQIPVLLKEGYEADDLIGSCTRMGTEKNLEVMIVTGDKDMFQLVSPHVWIYDPMKEVTIGVDEVISRFGVGPDKVIEVMGLMGDSSDNIPGVPGIGGKTAARLIKEYGSIESLLASLDKMKSSKLKDTLKMNADIARLSRELAKIDTQAPCSSGIEELKVNEPDIDQLKKLFTELEFYTLLKTFEKENTGNYDFTRVDSHQQITDFINKVKQFRELIVEPFVLGVLPRKTHLTGLALGTGQSPHPTVIYLAQGSLFFENLKPILEDPEIKKFGHDLKQTRLLLRKNQTELNGIYFDTMIASYLIHPTRHQHTLDEIVLEHLNIHKTPMKELVGSADTEIVSNQISLNKMAAYACESIHLISRAREPLASLIDTHKLNHLFFNLEIPLISVLADMEYTGVKLDLGLLETFSKELEQLLNSLIEKIYFLAGEPFNVNSPKQLSEILFDRLNLKPLRKTKTGYSTDEGVLNQLALSHELPAEILNYRQLTKLKSTYVDVLPKMVSSETGRLHTSFNQTVAATGRLSSSDPNLQNIPVRGEWGKRIRQAFIADEGQMILSADYNQIELRVLAHMAQDQRLIQSFLQGEDVHIRTAAQIFQLKPEQVTREMRNAAKTINFGIIYGMGAFSLASGLGISQSDAKKYIEDYFSYYREIKTFIDKTILEAKKNGYVTTLLNRRRWIPELNNSNAATRSFGERTAINTPIQGSAADIIKLAMVSIGNKVKTEEKKIRMILQIHDELLFEVPEDQLEESKIFIQNEMERVIHLSIPLTVDIGIGKNWSEAH